VTPCPSVSSSDRQDGVSYEVRRYDAGKYAAISSEGRSFDQVTGELVRKLLMYIGGSNDQGERHTLTETHTHTHTHTRYYTQPTVIYYYSVCTMRVCATIGTAPAADMLRIERSICLSPLLFTNKQTVACLASLCRHALKYSP